ncbi:MAG: hypothetical protein ACOH5I_10200 [Oligoflexus sp.]
MKASKTVSSLIGLASIILACTHGQANQEQQIGDMEIHEPITVLKNMEGSLPEQVDQFADQMVKVDGQIRVIYSPHAFLLDLDRDEGPHQLLVLNATGYEIPLRENDRVSIVGNLRKLDEVEIDSSVSEDLINRANIDRDRQAVVMAKQLTGRWANERSVRQLVTYDEPSSEMIPKEMMLEDEMAAGAVLDWISGEGPCRLRAFYKTQGAVGDPCATTEDFATSILSEKQMQAFERYKESAGRRLAH